MNRTSRVVFYGGFRADVKRRVPTPRICVYFGEVGNKWADTELVFYEASWEMAREMARQILACLPDDGEVDG